MANRLTDTTIWKKQKWFKKLPIQYKLAWKYLTDECNHAGIWKIDISELMEDLGVDDFDFDDFLDRCNKDFDKQTGKGINRQRVMNFKDGYVWITGFMTFQYGGKTQKIGTSNFAVKSAFEILNSFNLYDIGIMMKYFELELPKGAEGASGGLKGAKPHSKGAEGALVKELVLVKEKVIKDTVKESNTVIPEAKKNFNTKPLASDFNGLPEQYITGSIQYIKITKQSDIDRDGVVGLWNFFKVKELTGTTFYQNEEKVYKHFMDTLKYQNFNNGTGNIKGVKSGGTSTDRMEALRKW